MRPIWIVIVIHTIQYVVLKPVLVSWYILHVYMGLLLLYVPVLPKMGVDDIYVHE